METEEKGKTLAVVQDEAPVYVPRICSWVDLSLTDVERLLEASATTEELQRVLCEILGLEDYGSSKEASIEVDLYFYAISSAKRNNFTAEQISAFFTILKSVHSMCKSTPYDNFQEVFQFFKELMVRHSISRPPFSICLFNMEQVKDITDYVLKTYFKHFKLYKYAFTKQVVLDLRLSYSGVPDTPEPPVGSEVELVETMDDVVTEEAEAQQENVEESGEGTLHVHVEHLLMDTPAWAKDTCTPLWRGFNIPEENSWRKPIPLCGMHAWLSPWPLGAECRLHGYKLLVPKGVHYNSGLDYVLLCYTHVYQLLSHQSLMMMGGKRKIRIRREIPNNRT